MCKAGSMKMSLKSLLTYTSLLIATSILTCHAMTPQMLLQSRQNIEDYHRLRLVQAVKNTRNISRECTRALVYLETSNNSGLLTSYIDAMGKPGSGILVGNMAWLGSYSECKAIPSASYCLAGIAPKPKNGSNVPAANPLASSFKLGLCVPKECSETDVALGLQDIFKVFGLDAYFRLVPDLLTILMAPEMKTVNCAKPSKYTGGVIATLTLCGVLLFLCLCGTVIEIVSSYGVHIKKADGFMPITNESPQEQQDTFTVKGTASATEQLGFVQEFFLSFSLIRNTSHILNTDVPAQAITSINGMRVLSILWVVLGHTFLWQLIGGLDSNIGFEFTILQRFSFQAILNAAFSVDSFFFLSGLLVAYLSFRQMDKTKGKLNLFKFYFHRFWRLTPVYMFVLLFYDQMLGFLGEGPVWYQTQTAQPCDKYWWTNLLYINNFYPTSFQNSCMNWTWYLANDMQFFIISPVIIFAAYRFGKYGLMSSVGVLLSVDFLSASLIMDHYHLTSSILGGGEVPANDQMGNYQSLVYVKPYCRISPYLVGMVLGYLLHVVKNNSFRSPPRFVLICGWCLAIVLALAPLYGTYKAFKKNPHPLTHVENVMYETFSRFSWSLALAWVIYACHTGHGGLVNKILSARFWIPLSRLTYCVYLVHIIILEAYFGSLQTVTYYSDVNIAWHFLACTIVSYLVAYMVSVTCEVPMMHLEKLIFKTDRKRH